MAGAQPATTTPFKAGPSGAGRNLSQRRGQRPPDRPRLRPDGARPLGHFRGRARRQFRPRRDDDDRDVYRDRPVNRLPLQPPVMIVPIARAPFAFGYALQAGVINPFISRPEHSQFILLVAVALIIVNLLLIVFGPDARSVQTSYSFDSFLIGPLIVDAAKVYAAGATVAVAAALFAF